MLSSEDSVSETALLHTADNVEKSEACNCLFMYRSVDVIAFACGDECTESVVPRESFPSFTIPVRCSPHAWNSPTKFADRAGRHSATIGRVSSRTPELYYTKI